MRYAIYSNIIRLQELLFLLQQENVKTLLEGSDVLYQNKTKMSPIFKCKLLFPPTQKLLAHRLNLLQLRKNVKEILKVQIQFPQIYFNSHSKCNNQLSSSQKRLRTKSCEFSTNISDLKFVELFEVEKLVLYGCPNVTFQTTPNNIVNLDIEDSGLSTVVIQAELSK
ncbi:Hypothetical_protein [Hexamita inflata]|uniref:Hypothetical_protein n=1 Tax=Hexamita inflata TaxID=28002 RepID=A0AA86TX01_9EUKA|nr:Hypothetical protein HINF_LOCUS20115 [Hexamita inflata]